MDEHITPEEMQNTYENVPTQETVPQPVQEPQEISAAPAEQTEAQEASEETPEAVEQVQEASEPSEEATKPTEQEAAPQRRRRRVVLDDSDYDLIRGGDRAQQIAYFTNARRRNTRLTGTVVQTEEVEGFGTCAVVEEQVQHALVDIPATLFIPPARQEAITAAIEEANNDTSAQPRRRPLAINDVVRFYIGAEVDFFVQEIRQNRTIFGNRIAAMKAKADRFFLKRPEQSTPTIMAGDEAIGRIVTVGNMSARIEVFGIETTVQLRDMSYTMIGTARDFFTPGMRIPVLIESVDTNGENYTITVSPKRVRENELRSRVANENVYHRGSRALGEVTVIRRNGIFGRLVADGVPFYCPFPSDGHLPEIGDKVIVNVYNVGETTVRGRLIVIEAKKARTSLKY